MSKLKEISLAAALFITLPQISHAASVFQPFVGDATAFNLDFGSSLFSAYAKQGGTGVSEGLILGYGTPGSGLQGGPIALNSSQSFTLGYNPLTGQTNFQVGSRPLLTVTTPQLGGFSNLGIYLRADHDALRSITLSNLKINGVAAGGPLSNPTSSTSQFLYFDLDTPLKASDFTSGFTLTGDVVMTSATANPNSRIAFNIFADGDAPGAAVPEPTTWAMMIIGFGAAGSVIRRRKAMLA